MLAKLYFSLGSWYNAGLNMPGRQNCNVDILQMGVYPALPTLNSKPLTLKP